MLRKALFVTTLLLFTYGISHGISDVDIHVCEAQASDDQKVKCYRELMLNPSCHVLKKNQLSCFRRSAVRTLFGGNQNASPQKKKSTDSRDDFFGQPQRLCAALSRIGLDASGWEADSSTPENAWRCLSGPVSFGSLGANKLKNEIAYHVYGATSTRANDIRIIVNANNPLERKQALGRLEAATRALLKEISEHFPIELTMALRQETPLSIFTDFGTVNLIRTAGQIESYTIALTDRKVASKQQQLRSRATDDLESCRKVTARAAGYSTSHISGTAVLLQGSGFVSYRLSGRGMDWFICKVYPGGKYKIEAAMDGKYPSEYIAEGNF